MAATKLQKFLNYLDSYTYEYRLKFGTTQFDNIELRFLVNSTPDSIIINCCSNEPNVRVNDYWYNGSILRKCLNDSPQEELGFSKTYITCYTYEEAFTSTVISLNPPLENSTGTTLPPVPTTPTTYVKKTGDTLLGPLFLSRLPVEQNESTSKLYVDTENNKIKTRLSLIDSNITNLIDLVETLTPDANKFTEIKDRISSLESTSAAFGSVINDYSVSLQTLDFELDQLSSRVTTCEASNLLIQEVNQSLSLIQSRVTDLEQASLPLATTEQFGVVRVGAGLEVDGGILRCTDSPIIGKVQSDSDDPVLFDFGGLPIILVKPETTTFVKATIIGFNAFYDDSLILKLEGLVHNGQEFRQIGSSMLTRIAGPSRPFSAEFSLDRLNRGLGIQVAGSAVTEWTVYIELLESVAN